MITNKIQVLIHRPVEDVFTFVVTPANTVQWLDVVAEAEKTSEGELGVGSVYRQLFKLRGAANDTTLAPIGILDSTVNTSSLYAVFPTEFAGESNSNGEDNA